ncbi:hypothetical protein FGB62_102g019 [Gracilaria domingensis]|nr:hypothetical protein FGB62_102g019 [Gracilaria domingensis]
MEKDSGQSLAHYASLAEAAAAGVAFSTREGFMPREAASDEAGREAQSDDAWARAGPQRTGNVFGGPGDGGPGEGGAAGKEEELLWGGCSGCELCTEQTLLMYIDLYRSERHPSRWKPQPCPLEQL